MKDSNIFHDFFAKFTPDRSKICSFVGGACILLSSTCAQAVDRPWYLYASYGHSDVDFTIANTWDDGSLVTTPGSYTLDTSDMAWKVYAGYRFKPYFWLEGGYVDLNETFFSGTSIGGSAWQTGAVHGNTTAKGITLNGVAVWPVFSWLNLYAKGGIYAWDTTIRFYDKVDGPDFINDDGLDWIYGYGLEAKITKTFAVRAEAETYATDFAFRGNYRIEFNSIGLVARFN